MKAESTERYTKYQKSEIDWLWEDIPAAWYIKRIKELAFLQSGDGIISEQIDTEGSYPVFGGNGLRGYYTNYTNDGSHILIGRQGALCGNINYASGKFWASEHAVVVYLKRSINMKWFGELLKVMNLNQYSLAAAQPGLAMDKIKRLMIPVPTLPEQNAIADYLETKTAQIDRQIDLLGKKATQYGKLKQSLINETVTRGLDKSVPMKESGVDWFGEVPAHWGLKRLKELVSIQNSNVDKKSHNEEIAVRLCNYVDVYKNEFITGKLSQDFMWATADESEIKKFGIKKNDLLITKDSETADDIAIPALATETLDGVLCGYHLAQIRANPKNLLGSYLFRLFQSKSYGHRFETSAKGITRVGLGQSAIADAITPVPPLAEQQAIAAYLDEKTAHMDLIVTAINSKIEKLKDLRKTLINNVITGKIKVVSEVQAL